MAKTLDHAAPHRERVGAPLEGYIPHAEVLAPGSSESGCKLCGHSLGLYHLNTDSHTVPNLFDHSERLAYVPGRITGSSAWTVTPPALNASVEPGSSYPLTATCIQAGSTRPSYGAMPTMSV